MNYGNRYEKNREDEAPEHGRKEDVRAFFVRLRLGPLDDFVTRARRHRSAWPGGVRCQTPIDLAESIKGQRSAPTPHQKFLPNRAAMDVTNEMYQIKRQLRH